MLSTRPDMHVLELFFHLQQLSSPKIAVLQAHNASRDTLWACRSAIFGECSSQNRDAKVQVVKRKVESYFQSVQMEIS